MQCKCSLAKTTLNPSETLKNQGNSKVIKVTILNLKDFSTVNDSNGPNPTLGGTLSCRLVDLSI